jgi:rRNA biogenesis protein RRP5
LTKQHLTDHPSHAESLFALLKEGTLLQNLVIIEKDAARGRVNLTMKPLLVEKGVQAVESKSAGDVLPGYVRNVAGNKAFIGFVDGSVGAVKLQVSICFSMVFE